MTTLIIARHGNTFESGEMPRRVGKHTDLRLTDVGTDQGRKIGRYLKENNMIPNVVYTSSLQRTNQTAKAAVDELGITRPVFSSDVFDEIDYGPDENKPETDVLARIGEDALRKWDTHGTVPQGWVVDPPSIITNWMDFADQIITRNENETILVVTSNGIARFAPHITGDFESFRAKHTIKLATGALGIFVHDAGRWVVQGWNIKPYQRR